ncbi:phytoene/squalene synthase family protein [Aestuariivirga sp.]|uniref:phytoene/squalene synthase family protein n=1 Tax=Aestuariivirga sp. TaxID=2650926 RepID=UPI0039E3401E
MSAAAIADIVRAGDRDRYLSTLFAPDEKRNPLLALYAFAVEVARIPSLVSEPQIGLIRLQWWHEAIEAPATGHPVAEALATLGLPKAPLHALVMAHEAELYREPFSSVTALETYLGETDSAMIQLAAMILAGDGARRCADAAGLGGVAFGLARMLHDPKRAALLPQGFDAKAHAIKRLTEARAAAGNSPAAALPAFLPVSLTDLYLRARPPSALRRQFTLWNAARRERF